MHEILDMTRGGLKPPVSPIKTIWSQVKLAFIRQMVNKSNVSFLPNMRLLYPNGSPDKSSKEKVQLASNQM